MYLRNPQQFGDWRFWIVTPQGKEIVIPAQHRASNIFQLTEIVKQQITQFDAETDGTYSKRPREEAKSLGYDWYGYLRKVVENQICMRIDDTEKKCWMGIGDNIHGFAKKIDSAVDRMPARAQKVATAIIKAATKVATGKAQKRMGGCTSCGGRRTFSPEGSNLGRKEKLNNL